MATYAEGQQQVYSLTEKETVPYWRGVEAQYNMAGEQIESATLNLYGRMPSFTAEEKASGAMYTWAISRASRLPKTIKSIKEVYKKSYSDIDSLLRNASVLAISNTYYREQFIIAFFVEALDRSFLNPDIIGASSSGLPEYWKRIKDLPHAASFMPQDGTLTELLYSNRDKELSQMVRVINSGLIQGKSAAELTKDIEKILGKKEVVNGVVKYTGAKANSARIARTEINRNLNNGVWAQMLEAQAQGIDQEKRWDATLDTRKRGAHAAADGQTVPVDENFVVGGSVGLKPHELSQASDNINCRCAMAPVVDGVQPTLRRGRNPVTGENEVFSYVKMDDWMEANGLTTNSRGQIIPKDANYKINSKGLIVKR